MTQEHSKRKHAILSASASKRWLNCPPSARLEENIPSVTSSYAEEGTYMHEICEYKIRHDYLHENIERPKSEQWDSPEVEHVTDVYFDFVVNEIESMKREGSEPLILIEAKLNFGYVVPDGFGIADLLLIGKNLIHVIDFKGGVGVRVSADRNSQMMLYALGALAEYGYIFNVERVKMSIVQPRVDNISTYEISKKELEEWGESIKPIAQLAYNGEGEQKTGEWCRFCRARKICAACKEEALSLAREDFTELDTNSDTVFKLPNTVPVEKLAEILPLLSRIKKWIDDVEEYLTSEAVNNGVKIPGYKLVEGTSKRTFTDIEAVCKAAIENGFEDIYKQEPLSLTGFEKLMGKKKFAEILGDFVTKPKGKPILVPESDPRPIFN